MLGSRRNQRRLAGPFLGPIAQGERERFELFLRSLRTRRKQRALSRFRPARPGSYRCLVTTENPRWAILFAPKIQKILKANR